VGEVIEAQAASRVTDADSDDALMARVRVRDAAAFRILVERNVRPLHRIAYRMIGDGTEAEDLAQEALLRLWRDAAKWQAGNAGTAAWLKRVVVNLCLDRLRRRRFSSDEAVPERADDTPLPPQEMDAARLRAATVAAIGALPDRQRAAIVLTYYEEVSNQVAAETMDMNIKAFESLLLRARSALRTALTPMKEAAQ
jgi:RNA polymerase sigma factor (sigma-70 family)